MFNDIRNQTLFWLMMIALTVGFVWLFQGILAPFLLGLAIAYLLNPLVSKISGKGMPRWLSVLLILCTFLVAVIMLLAVLVPILAREIGQLLEVLPSWIHSAHQYLMHQAVRFGIDADFEPAGPATAQQIVDNLQGRAGQLFQAGKGVLSGIVAGGMAVASFVAFVFLMPIVAFYMMVDWPKLTNKMDGLIPRHNAGAVRELLSDIDDTLAGFIRGQLSVCLILGLYYGIALSIVDLRFGFAIGMMAGVLSIMPYVGSGIGIITSLAVAWFTTHDLGMVGIVAAIFGVGQFVEGNFLTPKMVGNKVGLHPLWVIFALMAGGAIAGFVGMLIAVPVAAVIGVMVRFALKQYRHSQYYMGKASN